MKDLKPVYQTVSKQEAEDKLRELEDKWAKNIRWLRVPGIGTGTN
jgi:hypothetical protein